MIAAEKSQSLDTRPDIASLPFPEIIALRSASLNLKLDHFPTSVSISNNDKDGIQGKERRLRTDTEDSGYKRFESMSSITSTGSRKSVKDLVSVWESRRE